MTPAVIRLAMVWQWCQSLAAGRRCHVDYRGVRSHVGRRLGDGEPPPVPTGMCWESPLAAVGCRVIGAVPWPRRIGCSGLCVLARSRSTCVILKVGLPLLG